jgi:putative FmdB family regulatory protein
MPFYEYECSSCKFYTEVLRKISDAPLRKCPSCGRNTFKKLVSAPVFRLKGSGWYETDFKSDKDSKRNLAGDASKPAEDKGESPSKVEPVKGEATKAEPAKGEPPKRSPRPAPRRPFAPGPHRHVRRRRRHDADAMITARRAAASSGRAR